MSEPRYPHQGVSGVPAQDRKRGPDGDTRPSKTKEKSQKAEKPARPPKDEKK